MGMGFVVGVDIRKRFVTKERTGLFKSRPKVVDALRGVDISIDKRAFVVSCGS